MSTDPSAEQIDRERYEKARREAPEHDWILTEPSDQAPVIDAEGFAWKFEWDGEDEDERDQPRYWSWRRQVWKVPMGGGFLFGPSMCDEWTDVLDHGPIRRATATDDVGPKFLVYPQGWKGGAPVGDPVVYLTVLDAFVAAKEATDAH